MALSTISSKQPCPGRLLFRQNLIAIAERHLTHHAAPHHMMAGTRPVTTHKQGAQSCQNKRHRHDPRSAGWTKRQSHNDTLRSRNALLITETELKLMAPAAMIGDNSKPKTG